jgi:hypothetical protein
MTGSSIVHLETTDWNRGNEHTVPQVSDIKERHWHQPITASFYPQRELIAGFGSQKGVKMSQQQPLPNHPPCPWPKPHTSKHRRGARQHPGPHRPQRDPLPLDESGQRLAQIFTNGWDWIYAPRPNPSEKPQWETIKKFPLTPVEMWQLHQNPDCLIGARPGSLTTWAVIDVDHLSPYHPSEDPAWLGIIFSTLEAIGITRHLICQSSHSGGLHIYAPLPEPVSSFWLATTLQQHLQANGLKLRPGHCEIYPNPKRYIPQGQGFSKFAALRYPMQSGSGFVPLDSALNPLPWTLKQWLDAFDLCTTHQDIKQLKRSIEHSQQNYRIRHYRHPHSLEAWQQRIAAEKQQGWTGSGQSNEKFKLFACEARVFLGMDSIDAIAHHIQDTAQRTSGFCEYSNHVKDLEQRSREVATWAMRYYWPIGTLASRHTSYHSPHNTPTSTANFSYHQAKREAAQTRIRSAISQLQADRNLPNSITARAKAIAEKAHVSQQTLYKSANKLLWHPGHLAFPAATNQPKPASVGEITQPAENTVKILPSGSLKLLWFKEITQLYIYVGFCLYLALLQAAAALTLKGQRAAAACPCKVSPAISSWSELRATLPEHLQLKIAAAERRRQLRQQQEDRRRELAKLRQSLPPVDTSVEALATLEGELAAQRLPSAHFQAEEFHISPEGSSAQLEPLARDPQVSALFHPVPYCELSSESVTPTGSTNQSVQARATAPQLGRDCGSDALVQESLACGFSCIEDQSKFNAWFKLALQLGIVVDSDLGDGQLWVLTSAGVWEPWTEVSAVFTFRYLQGMLKPDTT